MDEIYISTIPKSNEVQEMHLLPCNIKYNGKANVNAYFLIEELDTNQSANMDDDATSYIFKETNQPPISQQTSMNDPDERTRYWDIAQTFQSFMLWDQDDAPDSNDCVVKAMDWMNVARCIHEPTPPPT
ncbi:9140_t:CDS:2 [Paraglomus occultum]|uniref:9140_t:CDS:1 n=1 Tax=Paraglomus occultum TaxID=144539 RepID=A0A9N8WIS0_9GLOM|nr:9140_t:CDS:2 [Paraglomus occultum]